MAKLVVLTKGISLPPHEFGENWITIGRADGNTFQLAESSISGRHCEVRAKGDELHVRDLMSTNGTFAAGRQISEGVVKHGQTFRLGDVELRFEAAPPPPPSVRQPGAKSPGTIAPPAPPAAP